MLMTQTNSGRDENARPHVDKLIYFSRKYGSRRGHSIAQTNSGRDVNAHVLTY
jgi:hypothetical protein